MSTVVFIGPTISKTEVRAVIGATCLPPAAQGDVYRAMDLNPKCIGIIDGYFDGVASIWHKEILWAMSQGVHVFGASSMGALRAAELADFGMQGVGEIFQDYQSGKLEDDDEVAVTHGPPELGYPALSEPMVSIRATLNYAAAEKALPKSVAAEIGAFAKSRDYGDRTWRTLIAYAQTIGLKPSQAGKFEHWLKENSIDQKKLDAVSMLEAMQATDEDDGPAHDASFEFEWTNLWNRATSKWREKSVKDDSSDGIDADAVLNELRLKPDEFHRVREAAMLRFLATTGVTLPPQQVDHSAIAEKINNFRKQHGLLNRKTLDQWLAQNDLSAEALEEMLGEEVHKQNAIDTASAAFRREMIKTLKLGDKYHTLAERARSKLAKRGDGGSVVSGPQEIGLPNVALLDWHFCQILKQEIPENIDNHLHEIGLLNREAFYRLLVQEYLHVHNGGQK